MREGGKLYVFGRHGRCPLALCRLVGNHRRLGAYFLIFFKVGVNCSLAASPHLRHVSQTARGCSCRTARRSLAASPHLRHVSQTARGCSCRTASAIFSKPTLYYKRTKQTLGEEVVHPPNDPLAKNSHFRTLTYPSRTLLPTYRTALKGIRGKGGWGRRSWRLASATSAATAAGQHAPPPPGALPG